MQKNLVFTDSHRVGRAQYKKLLDAAIAEYVEEITFLGDIDFNRGYHLFLEFMNYAFQAGIPVQAVRGNHDQAWLDYADGIDEKCKPNGEKDTGLKKDKKVLQHLRSLETSVRDGHIMYAHAFPLGKRFSGPHGSRRFERDHRFTHRELWHYSFGTDNTHGEGFSSYDPDVLKWNFEHMERKGIGFLVKGHEHTNKVWFYSRARNDVYGGTALRVSPDRGTRMEDILGQAVIQVGAFEEGNYAVLSVRGRRLDVEFRKLPN